MPGRLLVEMVAFMIFWLNAIPPSDGISDTLSSHKILTRSSIDYAHHCKIEFGEYVQTNKEHSNSMKSKTVGAIALCPTGNANGAYYFMNLRTGRCIN
eukprot:4387295-Ditylum_brightwellii.AAC.1